MSAEFTGTSAVCVGKTVSKFQKDSTSCVNKVMAAFLKHSQLCNSETAYLQKSMSEKRRVKILKLNGQYEFFFFFRKVIGVSQNCFSIKVGIVF